MVFAAFLTNTTLATSVAMFSFRNKNENQLQGQTWLEQELTPRQRRFGKPQLVLAGLPVENNGGLQTEINFPDSLTFTG